MEDTESLINFMNEKQSEAFLKLINGLDDIDTCLEKQIDHHDGNAIAEELAKRITFLASTAFYDSINEGLYNWSKGKVFEEMREDATLVKMKEVQLKLLIAGKMSKFEAINARTKKTIRNLEISIETLRSMLSYLKEQMNSHV